MIKVGSRVKFLHSTGVGIVRSIKSDIANVDVDGFEIPALLSDIVEVPVEDENAAIVRIGPDQPKVPKSSSNNQQQTQARVSQGQRYGKVSIVDDYQDDDVIDIQRLKSQYSKAVTQNVLKAQPKAEPPVIQAAPYENKEYNVKLAFVPCKGGADKRPETADLDAYIVNDSSYDLYYSVAIWRNGYVETIKHGRLEADTRELLRKFPRTSFAQIQTLHISLLPFKPINYVPQIAESFDIELHPLKFIRSGNYCENDYFDEHSFIFSLAGDDVPQPEPITIPEIKPKAEDVKPTAAKPKESNTVIEDLHIEAILESWENLSSGEVLAAQLARFNFVMETAIKNSQRGKIVFIHGVGKGKLKYELKKALDRQFPKYRYQDASFAEYGYGAIMVFLTTSSDKR